MASSVRKFCRSYWIALQRSSKDKRARSFAAKATFFILYLAAYAAFIAYTASDGWTGAFYAFIFASGTAAAILIRRWYKKQDEILNTSVTGHQRLRPEELATVSAQVRKYLHERALIVASLLARGGSEVYLASQDGTGTTEQVMTRQIQNGLLRERGLWTKLEPPEFELASIADGRWSTTQRGHIVEWCEQLRLLRWVLGFDAEIVPLAHFPRLDFSLAVELLRGRITERDRQGAESWEVRTEREVALQYGARIVSEMNARGQIQDDPGVGNWADEFRTKSLGPSTDYLAGARTIADLREDELRLLGLLAVARERYAAYLVEQLNTSDPFAFSEWQMRQEM